MRSLPGAVLTTSAWFKDIPKWMLNERDMELAPNHRIILCDQGDVIQIEVNSKNQIRIKTSCKKSTRGPQIIIKNEPLALHIAVRDTFMGMPPPQWKDPHEGSRQRRHRRRSPLQHSRREW